MHDISQVLIGSRSRIEDEADRCFRTSVDAEIMAGRAKGKGLWFRVVYFAQKREDGATRKAINYSESNSV